MIALSRLINILKNENRDFHAVAFRSSHNDIMPASLYLGKKQLFSVPKGYVYEQDRDNEDGSIEHRGWRSIVDMLGSLINKDRVISRIKTHD